jgi:uncharacterized BrkB/YihY/UPF0761 family membrane protein
VPTDRPTQSSGTRARAQAARAAAQRTAERTAARAQRLPWAPAAIESFEREQRSGASLLAGGLAYRLFFWIVSFGLVIAAIASFWVRSSERSLTDTAKSFGLSGVAAHSAASAVSDGSHGRWYLLVAGIVLVAYFGLGGAQALRVAALVAWRLEPSRMRRRGRASAVFTAVFVLGITLTMIATWGRHHAPGVGLLIAISAVAGFVALAVLAFSVLPRPAGTTWRSLLPGALLVGAGVTGVHLFVVYYLSGKLERSPKLYGTLGASTVVLLGLFLMARVIVSGMFLNATLWRRAGQAHLGEDPQEMPVTSPRTRAP